MRLLPTGRRAPTGSRCCRAMNSLTDAGGARVARATKWIERDQTLSGRRVVGGARGCALRRSGAELASSGAGSCRCRHAPLVVRSPAHVERRTPRRACAVARHSEQRSASCGACPEATSLVAARIVSQAAARRRLAAPDRSGCSSSRIPVTLSEPPEERQAAAPRACQACSCNAASTCSGCASAFGTRFQCLSTSPFGPIQTVERITPIVFLP